MPSYYFHLAFELCRHSLDLLNESPPLETSIALPSADSLDSLVLFTNKSAEVAEDCYCPPCNLDIFSTVLPAHGASTWASWIAPKKESRKVKSEAYRSGRYRRPSSRNREAEIQRTSLKLEQQVSTSQIRLAPSADHVPEEQGYTDWRFERISIESIDIRAQDVDQGNMGTQEEQKDHDENATRSNGDQSLRGRYVPSNPKTTEFGWGVVHLYRDAQETPDLGEQPSYYTTVSSKDTAEVSEDAAFVDKECTTLCILAVPSYMTPSDLLGWLGDDTREVVTHFRLVRTGRSNKFMVLMKFRKADAAKRWQKEWNGKVFNSMEPENCHVVFVKSIRFQAQDENRDPSSFPDMSNDPFTPSATQDQVNAQSNTSLKAKPAPPPTPSLVELPSCPVCLERMDDTSGLTTIFCQHVFHCACLQKWRGSGCPVCRYTQNDPLHKVKANEEKESECKICGSTANLWICLICGHLGCGRYESAHAFDHFEQTSHSFAMDVTTQHVWDYASDGYVHRLIQNKTDGKLVELPSSTSRHFHDDGIIDPSALPTDKFEKMSHEYTNLLTSQLDSQRLYFEQQIDRAADKAAQATAAATAAAASAAKATMAVDSLRASHDILVSDTVPALERDKERAERRAERFEQLARKMEKEWREKEVFNESLMDRIKFLEGEVEKAEVKNCELEEQNRDLSFFISGMERLKGAGEEVREGVVGVVETRADRDRHREEKGSGGGGGGGTGPGTAKKKRKGDGGKK